MLIQSPKPAHWVAGIAFSTLLVACSSQTSTESVEDAPAKPEVRIKLTQPVAPPITQPKIQPFAKPNRQLEEIAHVRMDAMLPISAMTKHRSQPMPSSRHASRHGEGFYQETGRENYQNVEVNGVKWAAQTPVSTFSVDVDSAAYANMRRQLNQGQIPHPDSIRVEELVNYFSYSYPRAKDLDTPFSIFTEMGPSPWHSERKLVHIGINGWQDDNDDLPPANLVFLIDVSGSMQAPNKIQLLKSAMKMMVKQLRPQDSVAIAVYAGAAGQVLAPTAGDQKATITQAIDNLVAGGSTNGAAGIRLAYNLARNNFKQGGVNRVLLATDGDFNVGTTDIDALEKLVESERKSGVALTVLGFGTGNYNDHLMQKIAQIGNGNAAYIDNINEARKVLVEELGATLNIIAKDMKVQVEFNPAVVETYRLIGYETRHLNREDFNNDKVDAGDVGAGHTVTALYEVTLRGEHSAVADPLRYQQNDRAKFNTQELANVKLRYKQPNKSTSRLIERPLKVADIRTHVSKTSNAFQFSAAVAWLGQHLSDSNHVQNNRVQDMISLALAAKGNDDHGYRSEFINLLRTVDALTVASNEVSEPDDHS
ncbi:MAG: Ca-activated chloride channel family protein [Limisphaerales bacterium]|jgi:Ca-activated chloride channel family protein